MSSDEADRSRAHRLAGLAQLAGSRGASRLSLGSESMGPDDVIVRPDAPVDAESTETTVPDPDPAAVNEFPTA